MATYTSGDDPTDQQAVQHYQQEMSRVTSDFSALSQEMLGLREQLRMAGQPLAADIVEKIQEKEKEKLQLVSCLFVHTQLVGFVLSFSWISCMCLVIQERGERKGGGRKSKYFFGKKNIHLTIVGFLRGKG